MSTLFVVVQLVSPSLVDQHMARMQQQMGTGLGMMRGQDPTFTAQRDASLESAFRAGMQQALLLSALAAVLAAVATSFLVSGRITHPLERMARATRRIASGGYQERVTVAAGHEGDEIGRLAASFNDMACSLEETEQRRLALIGDVAHELRTPITTLEGYLEGLLDGVVDPAPELWAKLHGEAGRLRRLVADLQELSRAEAHQIPLRIQAVRPGTIVRATVDRLAHEFETKGIDLRTDLPVGIPDVRADQDRAVQVLTNLLTNALRYTSAPGQVVLSIRPADDAVQFSVRDTGIGIAPAQLDHVFERFYRVDKSRSRALGGAGIGLTISKALVEAMGGTIGAESEGPGSGSTFSFTLPLASNTS